MSIDFLNVATSIDVVRAAALVLVVFAVLIGGGVYVLRSKVTIFATVIEVVSHGSGLAAQLFALTLVVPHMKEVFAGYGTELGGMTVLLIQIGELSLTWWEPLVVMLVFTVTCDGLVFGKLHEREETRKQARRLSGWVTGCIAMALTATFVLLAHPMIKLYNDLS